MSLDARQLLTPAILRASMPSLTADQAASWAPHLGAAASEFGISTPVRMAMWIAQLAHESGELQRLEENLRYSAKRMMQVWPRRFAQSESGIALARALAFRPEALAEEVYGGRIDLGNSEPGDGWRYRGRGAIMTTGRANYRRTGQGLGVDLEAQPDLLVEPVTAARAAGWFWEDRNLNRFADAGDLRGATRRINGGVTGLAERESAWQRSRQALGLSAA